MTPRTFEFRNRSKRAPGGDFRIFLGTAETKKEEGRLAGLRELLQRLASRGEWEVLQAVKDRQVSPEHVERLVDEHGIGDFRVHLELEEEPEAPVAPSLEAHADAWLRDAERDPDLRDSTVAIYRRYIRKLLDFEGEAGRLGDLPWNEAAPRHVIREARNSLELASNTIRSVLGAWSSFFQWAIEREESVAEHEGREPLLAGNPVRNARVWSKVEITRHRFLSREEYARLIEVASPPMRAQYATLTWAGLRIEEFTVLPPAHVFLPGRLHVGRWGDWRPKVDRSIRDVPIHREVLLPLLEEYAEEWAGEESFFVNPSTGRPWVYWTFRKRFGQDVEAAGLRAGAWSRESGDLERFKDGVTPHTLRHTFGSWLAQADVQLVKIAQLMGDTVETVQKHYLHLVPKDLDRALNRLRMDDECPAN